MVVLVLGLVALSVSWLDASWHRRDARLGLGRPMHTGQADVRANASRCTSPVWAVGHKRAHPLEDDSGQVDCRNRK
eukprot:7339735-Alexandrium_andersonii.AAC.1